MSDNFRRDGYSLDGYAEVVQRLSVEFAEQHSYDAITAAVMKANTGTNNTSILLEEARRRLQQLPPTRHRP